MLPHAFGIWEKIALTASQNHKNLNFFEELKSLALSYVGGKPQAISILPASSATRGSTASAIESGRVQRLEDGQWEVQGESRSPSTQVQGRVRSRSASVKN